MSDFFLALGGEHIQDFIESVNQLVLSPSPFPKSMETRVWLFTYVHKVVGKCITVERETFEGENFRKFCGFVAQCKSFLRKIWGVASFGTKKVSSPQKFSPQKLYFSQIRESFLPRKFPAIQ